MDVFKITLLTIGLAGCAGVPVTRCVFDTRPEGLGFNECFDNQKTPEGKFCFDEWKKYGSYKTCIENQNKVIAASSEDSAAEPELTAVDTESKVQNCKFVGTFRGSSFFGGVVGGEDGLVRSLDEAKDKALKNGATHFMLSDQHITSKQNEKSFSKIKAYDCNAKTAH